MLPRPRKCRKVCSLPRNTEFLPANGAENQPPVILGVDEYEALRLIDKEGLSQEQCGAYMKIARTSVQQIYTDARKKIADMLVEGLPLRIEGGNYRLCDGTESTCGGAGCPKYPECHTTKRQQPTGGEPMKIAVTYENGQVFQHFGHTEHFKIYEVEQGKVAACAVVDTNGSGHGALAGFLRDQQVDTLICGGIGGGARSALDAASIQVYGGVSGNADQAVEALLQGNLHFDPDAACSHHEEGHGHSHGHTCGEHGCGEHPCGT